MIAADGQVTDRVAVVSELRSASKLLLATHDHPDGDALGSLSSMQRVLAAAGKDVVSFVAPDELPLPGEYAWLRLEGLVTALPADVAERTVVFLDCGNIDRIKTETLHTAGAKLLNIDHHHDNPGFGDVNLVVPDASCTAEIVWSLMSELGVELTPEVGEALYVGLVTDTGRFMYENTTARSHAMAAAIIDSGVDVHAVYRRLYEGVPEQKLGLLARGLGNVERFDGGLLTLSHLSQADFQHAGADESLSEGVIDHLRAVQGTAVAGLVRELLGVRPTRRKVSLRATDDRIDVSQIARAMGGGGHRRAAGFSTELELDALVDFLRREVAAQL